MVDENPADTASKMRATIDKGAALLCFFPCLDRISPHLISTNLQLTPLAYSADRIVAKSLFKQ